MEKFDDTFDIFDIIDDDNDPLQYKDDELNQYFFSGHLNSRIYGDEEEEAMDDDNFKDDVIIVEVKLVSIETRQNYQKRREEITMYYLFIYLDNTRTRRRSYAITKIQSIIHHS